MKNVRTILISAILSSVLTLCTTASGEIPGLVGHWKFDEGGGSVAYDSAGDKDGTVLGAQWVGGVLGGALDFDGVDDYVRLPYNSPAWLPEYDFTCSTWAYFDAPASVSGQDVLIAMNVTSSSNPINDIGCSVRRTDGGRIRFGLNTITAVDQSLSSNEICAEGEWHHVVAVRAGTTQAIYLNGSLDNSRICPDSRIDYDGGSYDNDGVSLGTTTTANSPNGILFHDGKMDDVRIYDRALSVGEIEELYGQGGEDGLVAHWKFDEGGGTIAHDSAGTNDGTVYGATWADGILAGALDFDGSNDYVEVDSSAELNLNSAGTVSAWVSPHRLYTNPIVNKRGSSVAGVEYENYFLAFGNYSRCFINIGDGSNRAYAWIPEEDFAVDRWQHVGGTWDSSEVKIYLDGTLRDAQPYTLSDLLRSDAYPLLIGRHGLGDWDFDGLIDDVRIYNRALSVGEIEALYEAVPEPPEAEVYHVDGAGGSDFNDGLTKATAFATIQKGIDSSVDGGEVVVWPGRYSEAINFLGKAITVRSGTDAAVIEAPGQDAVTFHSGEGAASVLKNFVIRNSALGVSANYGSSPTLTNLTIVDNDYGISAYEDSNPNISNCILWDNRDGDMWGCQARYSFVEQEIDTGPVDGLIGHWKFNEGSGTTADDSAGTNDGAIHGAQWVMGQLGGALGFDGTDDYVSIPASDVFEVGAGDISLSMWFKTSEYADQTLMKLRQYDDDPLLEVYTSTTFGNLGTRAMPGGAIAAYNAGRIDDGAWHNVAVSIENGQTGGYKLYLDGILASMTTFSGDLSEWNAIAVGNDADGGGFFNGSIDDVRIYNKALSSLDAYLLYQMSRGGPVAHWKFDEGAGSIAYDSAGSNDGVVRGAQWIAGQVGEALSFDGVDDYVEVPDNPSLQFGQNDTFSISVWVMPVSTGEIVCKMREPAVQNVFAYIVRRGVADPEDFGFVTEASRSCYRHFPTPAGSAPSGMWHHVVTVYDNKDVKVYLNGELSATGIFSGCNADNGPPDGHLTIGAKSWETTIENYFDGIIDDVRICDRALSASEIKLLYNGGLDDQDYVDTIRPLFANSGARDYHLLSERGRYWPAHDVWVLDKVSSPCIDMGDPSIEPAPEPMPNGGALNIGAYGGTAYASMSEWPIFSDYDRSGRADFGDFAVFCDEWLLSLPWAE